MEPEDSMASPTYRKAFKDFIKAAPRSGHYEEMAKETYLGSDRAAVILQASNVERQLEGLLLAKMQMRLSDTDFEKIFEGNGPLSTFSNKILVGFGLGLFGPLFRHDLDLIRDLRNAFAHVRLPLALTQIELAGMCEHLHMADPHPGLHTDLPVAYSANFDIEIVGNDAHPRTRSTRACHSINICMLDLAQFLLALPGGVERRLP